MATPTEVITNNFNPAIPITLYISKGLMQRFLDSSKNGNYYKTLRINLKLTNNSLTIIAYKHLNYLHGLTGASTDLFYENSINDAINFKFNLYFTREQILELTANLGTNSDKEGLSFSPYKLNNNNQWSIWIDWFTTDQNISNRGSINTGAIALKSDNGGGGGNNSGLRIPTQ